MRWEWLWRPVVTTNFLILTGTVGGWNPDEVENTAAINGCPRSFGSWLQTKMDLRKSQHNRRTEEMVRPENGALWSVASTWAVLFFPSSSFIKFFNKFFLHKLCADQGIDLFQKCSVEYRGRDELQVSIAYPNGKRSRSWPGTAPPSCLSLSLSPPLLRISNDQRPGSTHCRHA